jgi:hypothetical protein
LLVQKVTKKDTTPKDTAILLSHALTTLIAMQIPIAIGIVSAPGVDYPHTCFIVLQFVDTKGMEYHALVKNSIGFFSSIINRFEI